MTNAARRKAAVFLTILITQTISLVGSRMTAIGMGFWVFSRTGSTTPLLLAAFFSELPGMLFGSLSGVIVDHWPRKAVLILSDAGQAAGTLILLVSLSSGRFAVWHLYTAALFQGVFATLQAPAEDATVSVLIPANWRERANAFRESAFPFAGIGAPVLAGFLYSWVGVQGIIWLDLASFGVAVAVIGFVTIPKAQSSPEGSLGRGSIRLAWLQGLDFLRRRPALLYLLLFNLAINFLLNGPLELNLPYLISRTGDEKVTGYILGALNFGALSGAILMTIWGGTRPRIHTLMPGLLLCGAMIVLYGMNTRPMTLGVITFLLYAPLPVGNAIFSSIVQAKVPQDLQGRIFGLNEQLGFIGSTTSFALVGPLVDRLLEPAVRLPVWNLITPLVGNTKGAGMGLLLVITGALILCLTGAVYAWPLIRRLECDLPDYEPPAADVSSLSAPG